MQWGNESEIKSPFDLFRPTRAEQALGADSPVSNFYP